MFKLILVKLLILSFSLNPMNIEDEIISSKPDYLIESTCTSLFLNLALGQIEFEEFNLLFTPRCSASVECPEGADHGEVGCSGPSDAGCSADEDSVTCGGQTTSCYCTGTEICEN